jgi:hypothetical protein
MFSFVGDTVLDPFLGTGTTTLAAAQWGRNSIGYELEETYLTLAQSRIHDKTSGFFKTAHVSVHRGANGQAYQPETAAGSASRRVKQAADLHRAGIGSTA